MRPVHFLRALAIVLAVSGCGKENATPSASLDELPDVAALTLETQGGSSQALTFADAGASEVALATVPSTGDDLAEGRAKIAAVNEAVRALLGQVGAVVQAEGAPQRGDSRTYGPVERCVVAASPCPAGGTATLRLQVARPFGATWTFALEAQVGAEWKPIFAGWMRRGAVVRRGAGRIAVNLEDLKAAAPAYPGQGWLLGGFSAGPVAKTLRYTLLGPAGSGGFTPDPARWPAATARFHGLKTAAGVTRIRVAAVKDVYPGTNPNPDELVFGRLAFHPGLGGRAYTVVSDHTAADGAHGDVPAVGAAQGYFFSRACYAPGATTPAYKEWFLCARTAGPAACVLAQGGAGTPDPGSPAGSWQTTCALASEPAELQAPAGVPGTAATDDAAEPGESQDGIEAPESPPVNVDDVTPTA